METNAPLYHKLYQLTKKLYSVVHNMPREYKYELGREILRLSWECLDLFFEANSSENIKKKTLIQELSNTFDGLKLRLRMAQELKLISEGQFSVLQEEYLLPTGKMIGGWLNWSSR